MKPLANDEVFRRLTPFLAVTEPNAKGWWDAFCPLHEDTTRSAGFNFDEWIWKCQKNCGSGDLDGLMAMMDEKGGDDTPPEDVTNGFADPDSVMAEVIDFTASRKKKRRTDRPLSEEFIDACHERLMDDLELMDTFIAKRGLSAKTIESFGIGWSDEDRAYTLPIRGSDGRLVNIRLYRAENVGATKIWHWGSKESDPNTLFPVSQLEHDIIVIAEGEWDALMCIQYGFPAITGTTGVSAWQPKWNSLFKDKTVYIVYDRDDTGVKMAGKVGEALSSIARAVYVVELPLPFTAKDGEDITDFFHKHGKSAEEFRTVLRNGRAVAAPRDGDPIEVSVRESYNPSLSGKPMSMTVSVVGVSRGQHLLPRTIEYTCGINAGKMCSGCPMAENDGEMEATVKERDPIILRMRDVSTDRRDEELRLLIGANKCGRMNIDVTEWMNTELLVVRSSVDHAGEDDSDSASRTIVNVNQYATEANRIVKITGTTFPSPREQESTFLSWSLEPVESSLDTYQVTPEDAEIMTIFQPVGDERPKDKLWQIAQDLSSNVTRIIGRPSLHVAMDLVWHSVIMFDFAGAPVDRGWLDLLVVGDARTGKSAVAVHLSRHYGFGRVISCEAASIAGLLGAVKPMPGGSKNWTLEWGAIPLNDRRLVALDEAGGLTPDQISQLSSIRSSGIAEIIKAETEQTRARTRLVWLANPRDNRHGMATYMYGVRAIQPLIGNQEDVARFDMAMSVRADDVELESINNRNQRKRPHVFTSDACHRLVRWVWSRKREDVVWESDAEDAVYEWSVKLGQRYVPDPPLIQGQNVRMKIARLATAVAARTFSTDDTHEKVIVKKIHVDDAVHFLSHIYDQDGFGYGEVSRRAREDEARAVAAMDDVKEYLYSRPNLTRFLVSCGGAFRRQQMEEMLNLAREEANVIIQRLAGMNMIQSNSDWDYRLMPHLNSVLRELTNKGSK